LQASRRYKPFKGYAQSKLANTMTAAELQRRFDRAAGAHADSRCRATAVSVHPGLVDTALARTYFETDWLAKWLAPVGRPLLRALFPFVLLPPAMSARTLLWAAFAPAETVAGAYVSDCAVKPMARAAEDPAACARLWDVSCKLAGMDDPL